MTWRARWAAWFRDHVIATQPPAGPALWRITYWRGSGTFVVQFYRNGEPFVSTRGPSWFVAWRQARIDTRWRLRGWRKNLGGRGQPW